MTASVDPAAWVRLLVAHAGDLRKAGVAKVSVGDCAVEFAPYQVSDFTATTLGFEPAGQTEDPEPTTEEDPFTYGLRGVPGYRKPTTREL